MKITEVRVYPTDRQELRGYASITFDDCLMIRDFKILRNQSCGLYVAMPTRKQHDGSYREYAYPIHAETRTMIEEAILKQYKKVIAEDGALWA